MRSMRFLVLSILLSLVACASNPDVVITHFRPKASVTVQAVRTVGCSGAGPTLRLHSAASVTVTPAYERNENDFDEIGLRALDGDLANTNLAITLTEDGRLRTVNAESTGVGQEVLQSAVKLVSLVAGIVSALENGASLDRACALISALAPKDKLLTLTYLLSEDFFEGGRAGVPGGGRPLALSGSSLDRLEEVESNLPALCAVMARGGRVVAPIRGGATVVRDHTMIALRQPVPVEVRVVQFSGGTGTGSCASASSEPATGWTELWNGTVNIPQLGEIYQIPIPTAALFGGNRFQLVLSDSGAVTTISYGLTSGAPAALGSAVAVAEAFQPRTTAERAAELDAQADLIANQQRLVRCQQDPTSCGT